MQQNSPCASCGAPLAEDQRYCLECGERRAPVSDFLKQGALAPAAPPSAPPPVPPGAGPTGQAPRSNNTLSLLAGVGVLLIAMGVGVLIGRSSAGGSRAASTAPQVIDVAPSGGAGSGAAGSETFTSDWPSGTKGYTVELQTLPETATTAEVERAKTTAGSKGASSVGALKAEEFSSIGSSGYVIYSGDYKKRSEAEKTLGSLKKSFPSAKVIDVSEGSSGKGAAKEEAGGGGSKQLNDASKHAAGPAAVKGLEHSKGKSYVEAANKLPDVVSTG